MEEIVGFLRNHFRFGGKTLLCAAIGDRHTSDIGHWFAMTW